MADVDPLNTQRDVGSTVVSELAAAGFERAEEIGRGGFGIVYRCAQKGLDRTVAVKVLTAHHDEDRERFFREQQAMGRLTGHPNIVGVLQVGETESGHPFLVMQYHQEGSLEARIQRCGRLSLEEVLRLGVKLVGAVETAHRLGILHRDIKPANILYTAYGEPALTDFGIAHMTGAFETATGMVSGSPAFLAPEVLRGEKPSMASDVYGLGSTLFAALTGHAAYERRSGEQVVAQFLRIATESAPDLRETGMPDDLAAVVEKAMAHDPRARPSVLALGEELQAIQARQGFPVDEMALRTEPDSDQPPKGVIGSVAARRTLSNLPVELTSFVGRSGELDKLKRLLIGSPLVTVTGVGGVGKTRLALRAAADAVGDFPDGVRLVELGELRDGSSVVDVVAAALGLRDEAGRPLSEVLVGFLSSRKLLLVLDNCEQVIDGAAKLAETILRASPNLRILATSREGLGIGGESVLPLSPLTVPEEPEPTLGGLPGYDAVRLFAERAAAAVPGFTLTEENKAIVAQICSRLDGLPLAIELAAAKLRAMSPEQILERLDNRYALLNRGSRGAPERQQTLAWSVGWSYDLCSPAEQNLWASLSVFAGSFELEAAEDICGDDVTPCELVDLLSALVDKSILIRTESQSVVRFRLLDTLRAYGREKIQDTGKYPELRRRHLDWYRRLTRDVAAEWFGPRQIGWIQRLDREMPNLREAMEFSLGHSPEVALQMAADLSPFWVSHGLIGEGRRWLDSALAVTPKEPVSQRITARYHASLLASLQGDMGTAAARAHEAKALAEQEVDPAVHALVGVAEGLAALVGGDADLARRHLEAAVDGCADLTPRATALLMLARAHETLGDMSAALAWNEKLLALAETHDESVFRTWGLWSLGIESWRNGDRDRAVDLLKRALQLARLIGDVRTAASGLDVLSWIAAENGEPVRAAVMMATAETLTRPLGNYAELFPDLAAFHEECANRIRSAIGDEAFEAARAMGRSLRFDDAVAYALE